MNRTLEHAELDALAEACNIGMGHAATALSQLMGKGVTIQVPRLQVLDRPAASEIRDADLVRALHLQILGNIRGSIVVVLQEEHARRIAELLLGTASSDARQPLSEMEVSVLKEVGNIIASACLNAFGILLKMTLLPSVPTLISGEAATVLGEIMERPAHQQSFLMIDTVFAIGDSPCCGSVLLVPAPESLDALMAALSGR